MKIISVFVEVITARDVVISIIFTILGLILSGLMSVYFYQKALNDAKESAQEAERMNQLILRGIEGKGTVEYEHDSSGKIVGVKISLSGTTSARATATGTLSEAP